MRLEFINRVKEYDTLAKSIYANDGSVLLNAGTKLSNLYINKLKALGVFYLYVEDERLEDVDLEDIFLDDLKHSVMKNMSKITNNINSNINREIREAYKTVDELVDYIIEIKDVNKCLYDIQTYDNYTYVHSLDTGIMGAFLGIASGINENELKELGVASILHDVGKTVVPIEIISKNGPLSKEEYKIVKKHTIYGKEVLGKNTEFSESIIRTVVEHHERVDGKGYPYGLKNEEISDFSKIVAICDVYDAVSNDRAYRCRFTPSDAYELILAGAGSAFDSELVSKFRSTFAVYPLGACVKLSNGIEGFVVRQNKNFPDRPIIRVLYDSISKESLPFYELDLLDKPSIVVVSVA